MTGVVMCGGQSSRMGTDKGLLKFQGRTWAQTAADKLTALTMPVTLSVNEQQYSAYASIFPEDRLIRDNQSLNVKGPLCGVLSAHLRYPDQDLVILACDMPLLDPEVLKNLITSAEKFQASGAIVYSNNGEPEPLCGIYRAKSLAVIVGLQRQGLLSKHSMKHALGHISPVLLPLPESQQNSFRNFNAHAELNGL